MPPRCARFHVVVLITPQGEEGHHHATVTLLVTRPQRPYIPCPDITVRHGIEAYVIHFGVHQPLEGVHARFKAIAVAHGVVVVITDRNENLFKSFRNFPRVQVRTAAELCAYDVVNGGTIIAEQAALDQLGARVGKVAKNGRAADTQAAAADADGGES